MATGILIPDLLIFLHITGSLKNLWTVLPSFTYPVFFLPTISPDFCYYATYAENV